MTLLEQGSPHRMEEDGGSRSLKTGREKLHHPDQPSQGHHLHSCRRGNEDNTRTNHRTNAVGHGTTPLSSSGDSSHKPEARPGPLVHYTAQGTTSLLNSLYLGRTLHMKPLTGKSSDTPSMQQVPNSGAGERSVTTRDLGISSQALHQATKDLARVRAEWSRQWLRPDRNDPLK